MGTFYVSPQGNDSNIGTKELPWKTIAKLNATLTPGDTGYLLDGTYTDFPQPLVNGTAEKRILIRGVNRGVVHVRRSGEVRRSHVTYMGIHFHGDFTVRGTTNTHLVSIQVSEGFRMHIEGTTGFLLERSVVLMKQWYLVGLEAGGPGDFVTKGAVIQGNTFVLTGANGSHTVRLRLLDGCKFFDNRWLESASASMVGASMFKLFFVTNCQFTDCRWEMTTDGANDEQGWWVIRDKTSDNTFTKCTLYMKKAGQIFSSASGSFPGSCHKNRWIDCTFRSEGRDEYECTVHPQNGLDNDEFLGCQFIGRGTAMAFGQVTGNCRIENCTFIVKGTSPVITWLEGMWSLWVGKLTFKNNIIYRETPGSGPVVRWPAIAGGGKLVSDYNLYFGGSFTPVAGQDAHSLVNQDPQFISLATLSQCSAALKRTSPAIGKGENGSTIGKYQYPGVTQ